MLLKPNLSSAIARSLYCGAQGWVHPASALALDFVRGRGAINRRPQGLGLVNCTRSSTHLFADDAGVFRSFAENELARIDGVGAYIGGQVTNCFLSPDDLSYTAVWTVGSPPPTVTPSGDFWAIADTSNTITEQVLGVSAIPADTSIYTMWVDLRKDAESTIIRSLNFRLYGGTVKARTVAINTATGAWAGLSGGSGTPFVYDLGDRWRAGVVMQNNGTNTTVNVYLNPAFNTSFAGTAPDATLTSTASFSWPHAVTGVYPGSRVRVKGTRYASDVRTGDLEWFNAAGLGEGATELVMPNWSHVGEGVNRPLFEYSDGTASNSIKGYIDASDKPTLQIVSGGVTQTTAALSTSISAGRKPLVFGWGASGGYIGDAAGNVATFGAVTIPAVTQKRIGGSIAGNFMNDVIEQMQTCRPIAQADALSWAGAA